jgi:2-polyprenyl-3-methyl-5-hydroxy-6-metoxy-1,4-benzoquinol methylase
MQQVEQKLLIEKCISHLNPGGRLIIRTDNKALKSKDKGTSYLSGQLVEDVTVSNHMKCTVIDQVKNTTDVVFVINKNG